MSDKPLVAVWEGVCVIGEARLRCFVCNDGQRYFNADDVHAFFAGMMPDIPDGLPEVDAAFALKGGGDE